MEIGKPMRNSIRCSVTTSIWNSVMDLTRISMKNSVFESIDNSFDHSVWFFFINPLHNI